MKTKPLTKEEKQLLLTDLCARLPYGVKVNVLIRKNDISSEETLVLNGYDGHVPYKLWIHNSEKLSKYGCSGRGFYVSEVKPYLRPMSSMTEEEREHLQTLHNIISDENYGDGFSPAAWEAILDFNNYCREHHLDNGGLITLGLALEAPEGMYDTKQ